MTHYSPLLHHQPPTTNSICQATAEGQRLGHQIMPLHFTENENTLMLPDTIIYPDHSLGIYIHWPYCQRRCPYCAFNTYVAHSQPDPQQWGDALSQHLTWWREKLGPLQLRTLFWGGGTPSLMDPAMMERIHYLCQQLWPLPSHEQTPHSHEYSSHPCEISMEVNPTSMSLLRAYADAGVNRCSVGVQSLNDHDLNFLGRDHTAQEAITCVIEAQRIFNNRVSVDFITALPHHTASIWERNLDEWLNLLNPTHVSPYTLTIEPATPFARDVARKKWTPPDNEREADIYKVTHNILQSRGFIRYEVSNYAKIGYFCEHNIRYWQNQSVIGVGPGAHGRWHQHIPYTHNHQTLTPPPHLPSAPHLPGVAAQGGDHHRDEHMWTSIGKRLPKQWLDGAINDEATHNDSDALISQEHLSASDFFADMIVCGLRWSGGISEQRLSLLAERALSHSQGTAFWEKIDSLTHTGHLIRENRLPSDKRTHDHDTAPDNNPYPYPDPDPDHANHTSNAKSNTRISTGIIRASNQGLLTLNQITGYLLA